MKKIAVLGCTGSIGTTALNIIRNNKDIYSVSLLVNNSDLNGLKKLIKEFSPDAAICMEAKYFYANGTEQTFDSNLLSSEHIFATSDIVINGIVGLSGLVPSLATLKAKKILATANKESFVCAGNLISQTKKEYNGIIYPLDSEHNAIWQLIDGKEHQLKQIILTASGGAFRDLPQESLIKATAEQALLHPTWVMGKKVTIDCATLMNKGMEIIEAQHLFGTKNIAVVMHRESIVHSLVELNDNSVLAALSVPDMAMPIQYALTYPHRTASNLPKLDLVKLRSLSFDNLDTERFPCLKIAQEVAKYGDFAGTVMNGANEILVQKYLDKQIKFYDIPLGIEKALQKFGFEGNISSIQDVFCIDNEVKEYTLSIINKMGV